MYSGVARLLGREGQNCSEGANRYPNQFFFLFSWVGTRVVLILGILEFLRRERLWFEINKKKISSQVSSLYLNFNLSRTAMQVSHLNNLRFLALNEQFFIPAKVMVSKIWNSVDFILIIVAILLNLYRFLAIIILELQLDKILLYGSVNKL